MPRIASGSLGEASPDEMICCTRLAFAFRIDCSSAYTLKAAMLCGNCAPVLRLLVCATWIRRTSSSTWLRPSRRLCEGGVEGFQCALRSAQRDGALGERKRRLLHEEDILRHRQHVVQLVVAQPGQVDRFHVLAQKLIAVRACVGGHQGAVRVQRHEERIRARLSTRAASSKLTSSTSNRVRNGCTLVSSIAVRP
jgi:hypothetical protein